VQTTETLGPADPSLVSMAAPQKLLHCKNGGLSLVDDHRHRRRVGHFSWCLWRPGNA